MRGLCVSESVKVAFDIAGLCEAYGVGRSFVYEELAEGRLKAKKLGRKNLVAKVEADRWFASLPDARAA
jgi:excisionase family DNA binding protein